MTQGIIYLITNKVNGYKYVGQTIQSMNKVWGEHIQESRRMSSKPLHKAFRKYGVDKFTIKQIDECNVSILDEREEYWIQHYNTFETAEGYNTISEEETITFNQEIKNKIKRDNTSVSNISVALTKKSLTEPWGFLLEKNRGNGKHCSLKIEGTNLETGEVKIWNTINEAALELTGNRNTSGNISRAARNGYKCYGYSWNILEDKQKRKKIFSIDKKTGALGPRYDSIRQAAINFGNPNNKGSGLIKSLRNPGKYSWKGYYWYYANFTEQNPT
jgi:group I intron endonuclease